jgi:hypothetical protein
VLRRYTYAGIKFHEERGWYRVEKAGRGLPARHPPGSLRGSSYSPPAFDVCADDEAKALDAREKEIAKVKRSATDDLKVVPARPASSVTTEDLPRAPSTPPGKDDDTGNKRGKRERE